MVDGIATRDRTIRFQRVHVVVGRRNTKLSLKQSGRNELQRRRDNQLLRPSRDQQTLLIRPCGDLDDRIFERGFVQVGSRSRDVAVGPTRDQRMRGREQRLTITTREGSVEAVIQDRSRFHLLGVRHRTGQRLGVTSRQRVIEVVLDGLFSQAETQSDGFVVVTRSPRFLRVVVGDRLTFRLHRSRRESGQLGLLFERALGGLRFVEFLVLLAVASVLQTEQRIKAGQEFLQ